MPTAGEARMVANKRARSPDPNNNNPTPNKKTCDPRAESAIPRPIEVAFGKRATLKPTIQTPTEAQHKQIEITQKAQDEQDALAVKAAAAKAAKDAATQQDTAGIPEAIPFPGPVPSTSTFPHPTIPETNLVNNPPVVFTEIPQFETYPEAAQANPNVAYPQGFEGYGGTLDLTFMCMLSDNPHKALEIAKNLTEIMQVKQAIAELEAVVQINYI